MPPIMKPAVEKTKRRFTNTMYELTRIKRKGCKIIYMSMTSLMRTLNATSAEGCRLWVVNLDGALN